jgi:hypothetical protein
MAGIIAAAGAAAGAAAKQMADTLERFRVADATATDRAQSLESLGLQHMGVVSRLVTAGVILPGTRAGRFYLSEIAFAAYRRQQLGQQRVMAIAAVGVAIAALLAGAMMVIATAHAR